MKKLIILSAIAVFTAFFSLCNAQFRVVYHCGLGDTAAGFQQSSVLVVGSTIYSTSSVGGHDSGGSLFTIDTNGNNFKTLVSYTYHDIYGTSAGYLLYLNGNVYGIINGNGPNLGSHDSGAIFSYNTNTGSYKEIYGFDTYSGTDNANIIFIGNKIYGSNSYSGLNGGGTLFSVDTDGSNYRVLYNYDNTGGTGPAGIFLYGNKFFGTTSGGGLYGDGSIYSIDTDGNGFNKIFDFQGINGSGANLPVVSKGKIFGSTSSGGVNDSGVVYSIDTSGSNFVILYNFNTASGGVPPGNMILIGNILTGTTSEGGKNGMGTVFSADTAGHFLNVVHDFDTISGEFPDGYLTYDTAHGEIYGENLFGGPTGTDGTIFSFRYNTTGIPDIEFNGSDVLVYPNPANGIFNIAISYKLSAICQIEVYNVLGEKVYSHPTTGGATFKIDLSSKSNGIYFYSVKNGAGEILGKGKIIISK